MPSPPDSSPLHDISVVARLTGLSAANLRMWEKRYGVVTPQRSDSGRRVYSEDDVKRLTLLKNLSDRGHAIRKTCDLSIDELEQKLLELKFNDPLAPSGGRTGNGGMGCRVLVAGVHLSETFREAPGLRGATIIGEFSSLEAVENGKLPERADLLIVESPALFTDVVERVLRLVDQTDAVRAIVVYHFAQAATVKQLHNSSHRITAIRAPISFDELKLACAADVALANRARNAVLADAPAVRERPDNIPGRKFSDAELAKISRVSSAIECECPHHLAGLLSNLIGFERYSSECTNRNEADAKLHAYLHRTTAHARAIVEDALEVLVEFEGIGFSS